jgi:hypothetical protein
VKSDGSSEGRHSSRLRLSIEGVIDKLKSHEIHLHHSDQDDAEGGGIDKLLGKRMRMKSIKRRREKEAEKIAREEAARGRGVADRGTLENTDALSAQSGDLDVDRSSLLTYDTYDADDDHK